MIPASLTLDLREHETAAPETHSVLRNLFLRPEDELIAQKLKRAGALEIEEHRFGLHIQARSHVGRIRLGPIEVAIRPKIEWTELHKLVAYAYALPNLKRYHDLAEHSIREASLQDVLIDHLLTLTDELFLRGLVRSYVERLESLTSPRGRIDVSAIAREGGVLRETLPCRYHLRLSDWRLNRILLSGLDQIASLCNSLELRRRTHRISAIIGESVTRTRFEGFELERAERGLNRLTAFYEAPLRLIRLLLDMRGWSPTEGERILPLPGYLFDMNRFFQLLLLRLLRDSLPDFQIESERGFSGILSYTVNPRHRHRLIPKPDFIVKSRSQIVAVLDAKYRDLWSPDPPPREWLYQLAMYASSLGPDDRAVILYATESSDATEERLELRNLSGAKRIAEVALRPVKLSHLAAAIEGDDLVAERRRKAWTRELVFGLPNVAPDTGRH
jgi:5-methylcytosine-specific restriction enzyme subunit McrC